MFCPKCGSILMPKKAEGKNVMACSSCSFVDRKSEGAKLTEKSKEKAKVDVIESSENNILPRVDAECGKCGHGKAFFWTVQTRAGDEAETKFLKCEKCSHTWRDYD